MALTLSKVMQRVWTDTGLSSVIFATGGSTTTVVDTNTVYTVTNALAGGTAVVVRDAGGASAAPEGEFSRIASFDTSTKTFTLTSTLTAAVAANDTVLLATPKIKLPQMIQAVNDGLANLGTISLVDESITLAGGTYTYALPVGLKIKKLLDIQVFDGVLYRSIKGLVNDFPAAPAATGLLQFRELPYVDALKIIYEGVHPTLNAYSDKVSETIQEELAAAATVDKLLTWFVSKRADSALGTFVIQRLNDARQNYQVQKADKPVLRAKSAPKFFIAGMPANYPGDRTPR